MRSHKEILRLKRHRRILLKMQGNAQRPRLVVMRGLKNLHAQIIDDTKGKVLFSLSTQDKAIREKVSSCGNVKAAQILGEAMAARVKEKGIQQIIFDRAGYLYHGRIKAFAEGLRKGGLQF